MKIYYNPIKFMADEVIKFLRSLTSPGAKNIEKTFLFIIIIYNIRLCHTHYSLNKKKIFIKPISDINIK